MSVLDAAAPVTGSRTVPALGGDEARAAGGVKIFSAIAVESLGMSPGTVRGLRMRATTVVVEDTSPETARSPRRRGNRSVITVARLATWPGTVTMPMSRSATPVEALDTSRRAVRRSNVTGVVRSAMLPSSAARPAKSTATTVGSLVTWLKNAPSRPRPSALLPSYAPPVSHG